MLSRVAERVYWLSRYLERVENMARLINVQTNLLMDMPEQMEINLFTLVKIFNGDEAYHSRHDYIDENGVIHFLIADSSYPNSLINSLGSIRENARTSLDILPEDIWEQINELNLEVREAIPAIGNLRLRQQMLLTIMERCQCVCGILEHHMSRNYAFDFIQIGKQIERADMTSRILEMTSLLISDARSETVRKYEGILWANLLKALSAYQMFIQDHPVSTNASNVLSFLVGNMAFPRSLYFSVDAVGYYLHNLPEPNSVIPLQQQILETIQTYNMDAIPAEELHFVMDDLQIELDGLQKKISQSWFNPDFVAV